MQRVFTSHLAGILCLLMVASSDAAQFITDFNSGVPSESQVFGSATVGTSGGIGNSGVLKLTINAGGQTGYYYVNDFAAGIAVTNFKAAFKIAVGGGTGRPDDGFSFNLANDLPDAPDGGNFL